MEEKAKGTEKRKKFILGSIGIAILIISGCTIYLIYLNQTPSDNEQDIIEVSEDGGLVLTLSFDKSEYNISSDLPIEGTLTLINNGLQDIYITNNFTLGHERGMSINVKRPDNSTWGLLLSEFMYWEDPNKFPETFILLSGEEIDYSFDLTELDIKRDSLWGWGHDGGNYSIWCCYDDVKSKLVNITFTF